MNWQEEAFWQRAKHLEVVDTKGVVLARGPARRGGVVEVDVIRGGEPAGWRVLDDGGREMLSGQGVDTDRADWVPGFAAVLAFEVGGE